MNVKCVKRGTGMASGWWGGGRGRGVAVAGAVVGVGVWAVAGAVAGRGSNIFYSEKGNF